MLLLRDASPGGDLEVLMTRRSGKASFAPGRIFPGGGIDEADRLAHPVADRRPTQSDEHLTQAIAAIRESFEELGILLARHASGPAKARWPTRKTLPRWTATSPLPSNAAPAACAWPPTACSCWPTGRPTATCPGALPCPSWWRACPRGRARGRRNRAVRARVGAPGRRAGAARGGQFFMIFPTIRTLQRLARFANTNAVLAALAHEQPLWTSCPAPACWAARKRATWKAMPLGELALVCPDGQIAHPLDWQSERPVPLLKNVQRLTAPNSGVMTGPGTNSYLVGEPGTGFIAIDPGPADPDHLESSGARRRRYPHDRVHPFAPRPFPWRSPLQAMCEARAGPNRPFWACHRPPPRGW